VPENAPAVPPAQPDRVSDGEISPTTKPFELANFGDLKSSPGEPSRESILAAFARNRVPPQPAAPQPRPAQPQPRPPQRQAEPEPLSDAAIDELIAGWKAGNLKWPHRLLGGEPVKRIAVFPARP
jgi:hypothetical protein